MWHANNVKLVNLVLSLLGVVFFCLLSLGSVPELLISWEMSSVAACSLDFFLLVDSMSVLFMSFVSLIGLCVTFYAQSYLAEDPHSNRLSGLLGLFLLSMGAFVLSPNMMSMLLGWDGLGVVSFVLVLYYNNQASLGAALLTVLTNRVGDVLILMAIGLAIEKGEWDLTSMENMSQDWLTLILLFAACTKSAQFPFSAWLPAAMAAPTPVSSLVHSSTLVTAGVYLMIRLSQHSPLWEGWLSCMVFVSCVTSVMAGYCALVEVDAKKVVALSTLSQLGTMVLAVGLGAPLLAFFHLLTHAASKSLLFICVGTFISANHGGQDTRNWVGGTWSLCPVSYAGALLANLSLCGVPFLSGYYSKDLILESVWQGQVSALVLLAAAFSTVLTSAYTLKLMKLWSLGESSVSLPLRPKSGESGFSRGPVAVLSLITLVSGYALSKTWILFYCPLLLVWYHKYLTFGLLVWGWIVLGAEESYLLGGAKSSRQCHHLSHSMFYLESLSSQGVLKAAEGPIYLGSEALSESWVETLTVSAPLEFLRLTLELNLGTAQSKMSSYIGSSALISLMGLATCVMMYEGYYFTLQDWDFMAVAMKSCWATFCASMNSCWAACLKALSYIIK